jgi:hypothetical protein
LDIARQPFRARILEMHKFMNGRQKNGMVGKEREKKGILQIITKSMFLLEAQKVRGRKTLRDMQRKGGRP